MDNEERTAFTSLLAQLDSRNKRIKDLERQLDNYFIVSQKYFKLRQALREIKQIASREAESHRYNGDAIWKKIIQTSEVSNDMENN